MSKIEGLQAYIQTAFKEKSVHKRMEKIDPHKNKEKYLSWKQKVISGIPDISNANSRIILQYLLDMERGLNVSTVSIKGSRSYSRLNSLKNRMLFFAKNFEHKFKISDITNITEDQLITFFSEMRSGEIKKRNNKEFISVGTYAKIFKAFWHWWMKVNRKQNKQIEDITLDLDSKDEKPKWVYLTEEQIKMMYNKAKFNYKVLMMFLIDTGIRAPTELSNIQVCDILNDCQKVNVREEVSKTFGRKINLTISSKLLKEYIQVNRLKSNDYLFKINPATANKYFKRLAISLFGDIETLGKKKISSLSLYDFRHNSCVYWILRNQTEAVLKYRFGWKTADKVYYYSEFLGMTDKICESDLLTDEIKTELEKKGDKLEIENQILKEKIRVMEDKIRQMDYLIDITHKKVFELV